MEIDYNHILGNCAICKKDIYRGEGNVSVLGFKDSHIVHILHEENDYEAYHKWHTNLLSCKTISK